MTVVLETRALRKEYPGSPPVKALDGVEALKNVKLKGSPRKNKNGSFSFIVVMEL